MKRRLKKYQKEYEALQFEFVRKVLHHTGRLALKFCEDAAKLNVEYQDLLEEKK